MRITNEEMPEKYAKWSWDGVFDGQTRVFDESDYGSKKKSFLSAAYLYIKKNNIDATIRTRGAEVFIKANRPQG